MSPQSPRRYRATAAFHERVAREYAKRGNTRDAAAAQAAARAALAKVKAS